MKHDIQVCPRCGRAVIRLVGSVDGDELCEVLDALIEDEGWNPEQSDLWDLRALDDLYIAPNQVAKLVRRMPSEGCARDSGRTALITRTLTQRAYGNLFFDEINPSNRVRRSFRSERRAIRWLEAQSRRTGETRRCGPDCLLTRTAETSFPSGQLT